MERTLFKIVDICATNNIETTFIRELHQNGLIEIIVQNKLEYIDEEQLPQIERFSNWYYELELNMQGLEVVQQLLDRVEALQEEIRRIKSHQ